MKLRRLVSVVATAGIAVVTIALAAPATAGPGTYLIDSNFGFGTGSQAVNLFAGGAILNIPPVANSICNSGNLSETNSGRVLTSNLVTLTLPTNRCDYDPLTGQTRATAHITTVDLFHGTIVLSAVDSECSVGPGGQGKVGSTVGKLNGHDLSAGTGKVLNLPGLAQVIINSNHEIAREMYSVGVLVNLFAVVVNGHVVSPAQTIFVGFCSISAAQE